MFLVQEKVCRGKLNFFAYVIYGERRLSANRQKQLRNNPFHVKTSQSAKTEKLAPSCKTSGLGRRFLGRRFLGRPASSFSRHGCS